MNINRAYRIGCRFFFLLLLLLMRLIDVLSLVNMLLDASRFCFTRFFICFVFVADNVSYFLLFVRVFCCISFELHCKEASRSLFGFSFACAELFQNRACSFWAFMVQCFTFFGAFRLHTYALNGLTSLPAVCPFAIHNVFHHHFLNAACVAFDRTL